MDIIQTRLAIRFVRVFLDLFLFLLLWVKGKSKATFHLSLVFLFFGIYATTTGLLWYIKTDRLFLIRSQWIAVLALPALLAFIAYFTDRTKNIKLKILIWYIPAVTAVILAIATDYFVVASNSLENPYSLIMGPLDFPARMILIVAGGALGLYYLLRGYIESKGLKRQQLKYFIVAAVIFVVEKITTLAILPLYTSINLAYFYDIADDIVTFLVMILMVYVLLSKKMVFDMKVILTEILVGAIALILFIQAFLSQSTASKIFGFITFFFFLFAGYLLIRTTGKEIQKKEEVEKLAKELEGMNQTLEEKVKERTKELETSYQEIKSKKEDLERFYNLAVGRELKMAELKKEIGKLSRESEK